MKVYLAGPMRGCELFNYHNFMKAEQLWFNKGHLVYNPIHLVMTMGYDTTSTDRAVTEGKDRMHHVILSDVANLVHMDAIALLPGWEKSQGSTVEVALAQFLGLKIYDAVTMLELFPDKCPWNIHQVSAVLVKHTLEDCRAAVAEARDSASRGGGINYGH